MRPRLSWEDFSLRTSMKRLLVPLVLILLAWDALWALLGVKPLFPWQLQAEMARAGSGLVLLDVRTPKEYEWFHMPGARLVPLEEALAGRVPAGRDQTLVVICMTGHRSPFVAWHLKKLGFREVYNLTWGMAGWQLYRWLSVAATGERPDNGRQQVQLSMS